MDARQEMKICPFMNSRTTVEPMPLLLCQEEKCMAWEKEVDGEIRKFGGFCKLIERRDNGC